MDVKQEIRSGDQVRLPQEIYDPPRTESERVDEATRTIRRVVESASSQFWEANVRATSPKSRVIRTITFVASTWVVFFAAITMFTILAGWAIYHVSPLHSLQRIHHVQEQQRRQEKQTEAKEKMGAYYVDLGNSLLNVGEAKAANEEFERSLDLDPYNRQAQMGTLKCELFESVESKDFDPSIIYPKLDKLVETRPEDSHVYAFRGTVRYLEVNPYLPKEQRSELYKPALSDYEKAVRFDGSNAYAHSGMSNIYFELGEFDASLKEAKKAYLLAPKNPTFKHNYANALYANDRYDDAINQYEGVTILDPQFMFSYHDLAQLYRLQGDLELSNIYYKQFIALLEDRDTTSLDRNRGSYSFTTGSNGSPVFLQGGSDKRFYAYYSIALTSYVRGYPEDAEHYVNKAEDLEIDPYTESEIERLMNYDITVLEKEQQDLEARAEGFRSTFL